MVLLANALCVCDFCVRTVFFNRFLLAFWTRIDCVCIYCTLRNFVYVSFCVMFVHSQKKYVLLAFFSNEKQTNPGDVWTTNGKERNETKMKISSSSLIRFCCYFWLFWLRLFFFGYQHNNLLLLSFRFLGPGTAGWPHCISTRIVSLWLVLWISFSAQNGNISSCCVVCCFLSN